MSRRFSRTTMGRVLAAAMMLAPSACMLITSPGDFSIVDGSTSAVHHDANGNSSDGSTEAGACSDLEDMTSCLTCVAASCCDTYTACNNDPDCFPYFECGVDDTACQSDNMSGSGHANALNDCLSKHCTVCSEAGIGDPCGGADGGGAQFECMNGLTCNGTYCTTSCTLDSDCAGAGSGGDNSSGGENRCALDEQGNLTCFPGCNVASDCDSYPGTQCLLDAASIVNQSTMVCFPDFGDGGIDANEDGEVEPDAGVDAAGDASSSKGSDATTDATIHANEGGTPSDAAGG